MFRQPEFGNDNLPEPPVNRRQEILLQLARIFTGLGFIATSLAGLESLFGDQNFVSTVVERTGDVPVSLGAYIIELRQMGFSDEMISISIFAIAGLFLAPHILATRAINRLRQR